MERIAKRVGKGAAIGLAVSVPLTIAAKKMDMPILMEVGQRVGSVASATWGREGNAGYQLADAMADRMIFGGGLGQITGTKGVGL